MDYPAPSHTSALEIVPALVTNDQTSTDDNSPPSNALIPILSCVGGMMLIFILIMVTIAMQSHRHPERYSEQGRPRRPKQSRPNGLTSSMLKSIPIVKFGENNDKEVNEAARKDIELGDISVASYQQSTTPGASVPSATSDISWMTSDTKHDVPVVAPSSSIITEPDIQARSDGLGCSICIEDFIKSEEIRVLPCDHKFHAICIDPWLLQISSTCPTW
ncbi:hypothetical protein BGZ60DRAFT_534744 [Tricladium varicosporioides]|nr:hypothetical protein BGZ60DRAFT_534744 [Hymenoscyphus varicosporioides]